MGFIVPIGIEGAATPSFNKKISPPTVVLWSLVIYLSEPISKTSFPEYPLLKLLPAYCCITFNVVSIRA